MDCGAWTNTDRIPYVVRIRGCEFGLTGAELTELISHLENVKGGWKESVSEDLKDLRIARRNEARGVDLIKRLNIPKPAPRTVLPRIERRL